MSTMSEKRAARKAEKRIEREEAEAGFRLNKIKPVTNGLFNAMFAVLSCCLHLPLLLCADAFHLVGTVSAHQRLRPDPGGVLSGCVRVPVERA